MFKENDEFNFRHGFCVILRTVLFRMVAVSHMYFLRTLSMDNVTWDNGVSVKHILDFKYFKWRKQKTPQ